MVALVICCNKKCGGLHDFIDVYCTILLRLVLQRNYNQVFDTTSSRELLYAHRQRLRMTPKQHRTMGEIRICAESAHASSSSQGTPGSQGPHAAASWRGKASVDGGSSTSRAHSPPRGGGIVGARSSDGSEARETSGAPDNSSVIVLSTDAAEQCRRLLPFCR